jgi:hypothetical protein
MIVSMVSMYVAFNHYLNDNSASKSSSTMVSTLMPINPLSMFEDMRAELYTGEHLLNYEYKLLMSLK